MPMIDQGEQDDKIIAVHADDPEFKGYSDISELPKHRLMEIKRWSLVNPFLILWCEQPSLGALEAECFLSTNWHVSGQTYIWIWAFAQFLLTSWQAM